MSAPEAFTSDTAAITSSSTPVLPASYFARDSEQIKASEALLVPQSSLLIETIPETQDVTQTQVSHGMMRLLFHVELRRPTLLTISSPGRSSA